MIPSPKTVRNTSLLQQLPTSIALLDTDFRLIDASRHWMEKFGLQSSDIKGKTIFEIFPRLSNDWKTRLEYAMDGLKDIQIMDRVKTSKQISENFIWNLNPWKDGYGNEIGVVITVKEVPKTKELQLELKRTKNLLDQKGKIARIGSWDYSVITDELFLAPAVREIFNVNNNSKITLDMATGFYRQGESRRCIQEAIQNAIHNGLPWNENLELLQRDGKRIWVNTIGRPKFKDGKCTRIIGTVQDITEKMNSDTTKVVQTIGSNFEDFFDFSPVGMVITDYKSGKILNCNEALSSITGYTKEQMTGKFFPRFVNLSAAGGKSKIAKCLNEKGSFKIDRVVLGTESGENIIISIKSKLLTNSLNETQVLSVVQDVSPVNHQIKNLKTRISEFEISQEKLVNFAHMVSHNLKGHATNFSLLLGFLKQETNERERNKVVSVLCEGAEHLTDTIKGLREIVSIRNNERCKKEAITLNDAIYKTEQRLAGLVKRQSVKIVNEIPDSLKVKAVPVYLDSILGNCMSNAIRYRKKFKAPVLVLSATVQGKYTVLSIEDNGIGIDMAKDEEKLFALYKTLNNEGDSQGMGLYLTKYQMDLMKGKIEVESAIGEGATFKFYFPNN
ncbi:PAS domain S-box protein [Aggregatimonas sangjinii]|uniref:histidine kinase n=1 Tax=Aggregatimonas sangjinii TaxID=2583587 RepID=A0A5B7SRH3_9FLAO|nr:PAS domain S-box protein [Aggregatimonas sangjinii]QCX01285.1 PAS domain S-box protein [Aggregatimonas sangjinii]